MPDPSGVPSIDEMFQSYCQPLDYQLRLARAYEMPRLLSADTVGSLMKRVPKSAEADSPWARLVELDHARIQLARAPARYPIGPGPVEQLLASGLTTARMLERCRSPELQALISPMYLLCIAYDASDKTHGESWTDGIRLSRLAAEAALVWQPEGEIDDKILEVMREHLSAACSALRQDLDETIFTQALALAETFLSRAERQQNRQAIGVMCHALGVLFSDIWLAPPASELPKAQARAEWLARPRRGLGLFAGLGPPGTIPDASVCLRTAVAWYQRALPYRVGHKRGVTYKAIAATLHFLDGTLGQPIPRELYLRSLELAPELVRKDRNPSRLRVLEALARDSGQSISTQPPPLSREDQALLTQVRAAFDPGEPGDPAATRRRASHGEAVQELQLALRHGLPCLLYLRNFAAGSELHRLGEDFTVERDGMTQVIVPEVSYALVDSRLASLRGEGVFGVCDPALAIAFSRTLVPMLSLRSSLWLAVVRQLVQRVPGIALFLDEVTPGVQAQLDLLCSLGATRRTLVVTGQRSAKRSADLSAKLARFPWVVDWIDFAFDEGYQAPRYQTHGLVQGFLSRFVKANAQPVVDAWLGRS